MIYFSVLMGIAVGSLLIYEGLKNPHRNNSFTRICMFTAGFIFYVMVYLILYLILSR